MIHLSVSVAFVLPVYFQIDAEQQEYIYSSICNSISFLLTFNISITELFYYFRLFKIKCHPNSNLYLKIRPIR